MISFVRSGSWVGYVLVAAIATAAGGGLAFAASSGGTLHGCANKKTGALRLASKCSKREKKVSWNVRGPRGVAGPAGATGSAGAAGSAGVTGPPGPFPGVLPRGITLRGNWAGGSSSAGTAYESISFGFTFASAPTFPYVAGPVSVPAGCSGGTNVNPTAQPGNLCLYSNGFAANTLGAVVTGTTAWGTLFTVSSSSPGLFFDGGTWAATSP
jgi:hypothetical protein